MSLCCRVLVCISFLSFLSGCGGGGGGGSDGGNGGDGPSVPAASSSGKWVENSLNYSVEANINSPDDINYTGTIKFTDYSVSPAATTTANILGKFQSYDHLTSMTTATLTNVVGPKISLEIYYGYAGQPTTNPALIHNDFACYINYDYTDDVKYHSNAYLYMEKMSE